MTNSGLLGYIIVYVPDVLTTLKFYEEGLGLTRKMLHESCQYAELDTGSTTLAFAHETAMPGFNKDQPLRREGFEVAFVTPRVRDLQRRALDAGATLIEEPSKKPWGQTVGYVRDPDGTLIEICSPVHSGSEPVSPD